MKTRKKTYEISMDITMVKHIYIDAENEEQAREIVEGVFADNPYSYANNFSHYLNHEITDIEEV